MSDFSISATSEPMSGRMKKAGSSEEPVIRSMPFSVSSTEFSFSSMMKKQVIGHQVHVLALLLHVVVFRFQQQALISLPR
jgi:hypothetical protein